MDKNAVLKIILNFQKSLESKGYKINSLVLFGSYANGGSREGSDIDLVVISDDFFGKNYWERIDIISDAIYEVFQPIEATALTRSEWENGEYSICEYAKNGEVVYSSEPEKAA